MLTGIITSRLASTRLPRKALLDLCGKPMLHRIVDRVRESKVDDVIVATTTKDDEITDYCQQNGIRVYKGSEEDILDRLYCASEGNDILRVWGDSPLIDPVIIDNTIDYYRQHFTSGYLYTIRYPTGQNVAICDFKTLEKAHQVVKKAHDRLWIHKWFTEQRDTKILAHYPDLSDINLAVDTLGDLERVRWIYSSSNMGQSSVPESGSTLSERITSYINSQKAMKSSDA